MSEVYRPTERQPLVGEVTDPYGHILGFPDHSLYFLLQVAP
jgi:hypothetical protein